MEQSKTNPTEEQIQAEWQDYVDMDHEAAAELATPAEGRFSEPTAGDVAVAALRANTNPNGSDTLRGELDKGNATSVKQATANLPSVQDRQTPHPEHVNQ